MQIALKSALQWYLDHGVDEALDDTPINRFNMPEQSKRSSSTTSTQMQSPQKKYDPNTGFVAQTTANPSPETAAPLGSAEARAKAIKMAAAANTLDDLKQAIEDFDGLAVKKTATNMVFADGNKNAPIMLIGEAPGADEDRQGKPFVGVSGQLLDKILKAIDIERVENDPQKSVYISNILNWRPPGNRTPTPAEIEISLPFIEKHIALINPKMLILCGGVSAKALLGRNDSLSRMRKTWHDYTPRTPELNTGQLSIPAVVTYHPAYLLRTPAQKKATWADMISIMEKRAEIGF